MVFLRLALPVYLGRSLTRGVSSLCNLLIGASFVEISLVYIVLLFLSSQLLLSFLLERNGYVGKGSESVSSSLSLGHTNPVPLTSLTPWNVTLSHGGTMSFCVAARLKVTR